MKTLKEKQLEFLQETVSFYNLENRGVNKYGTCNYRKGCAIGRRLTDKKLCARLDRRKKMNVASVFNDLPENIKELGVEFLSSIQMLHDFVENWNKKGLSTVGRRKAKEIKKEFNL